MPGYRSLPARLSGPAADYVRQAELYQQEGHLPSAARMLETALVHVTREQGEMPAWICGRLAATYRSLARYEDEVHLLERYCESQRSEDASARFRARLSKARAIAERRRRAETGALQTVREVRTRSRNRPRGKRLDDSPVQIAS
jgi:hypothetical protein